MCASPGTSVSSGSSRSTRLVVVEGVEWSSGLVGLVVVEGVEWSSGLVGVGGSGGC